MFNIQLITKRTVQSNQKIYYGLSLATPLISILLASMPNWIPLRSFFSLAVQSFILIFIPILFINEIRNGEGFSFNKDVIDVISTDGLRYLITGLTETVFLALWSLLFVIPGIIKSYSYSMTPYLLNDFPELDPVKAITLSKNMMNGYKLKLFKEIFYYTKWKYILALTSAAFFGLFIYFSTKYVTLFLLFLVLTGISIIPLIIYSIYILPYVEVTKITFYRKIMRR